ncbi:MAG TPA: glycosyltransferase family 1 protein [Vicinamibacteria bacterium]|nr:glycosyltransferase family 1 protein [Vicinamibacteria bacterium]
MTGSLTVGIDARELQGHPTGTGRYLRNLLRQWTARGDDRFVAYVNGPAPLDPVLRHDRVRVRTVGDGRGRGLTWQQRDLPAAARADALDVFFAPAYSCPLALAVPRVTAIHDLSFFSYPSDFAVAEALRRRVTVAASVRASSAVLACSDFSAREIATRFPDAASRVRHVPLGPDDDLPPAPSRSAARARRGFDGLVLLTVGTILNRRCLPTLLQATAHLQRLGHDVHLDVVGENRTHPPLDLAARVERLGLTKRVSLVGYVTEDDLAERYAAADVAVFLSEYEGFGLPALEAAARGVPLVVSDKPALSEVFAPAALRVDPRDAEAVAAAVSRLVSDRELREGLVSRGHELAARHSWARTAELTRAALAHAAAS